MSSHTSWRCERCRLAIAQIVRTCCVARCRRRTGEAYPPTGFVLVGGMTCLAVIHGGAGVPRFPGCHSVRSSLQRAGPREHGRLLAGIDPLTRKYDASNARRADARGRSEIAEDSRPHTLAEWTLLLCVGCLPKLCAPGGQTPRVNNLALIRSDVPAAARGPAVGRVRQSAVVEGGSVILKSL